jgi:hypothetical protein
VVLALVILSFGTKHDPLANPETNLLLSNSKTNTTLNPGLRLLTTRHELWQNDSLKVWNEASEDVFKYPFQF